MKRVFISAATSSIGKVIARKFAAEGYELVLHYYSNKGLAERLADELKAKLVQADLSNEDDIARLIAELQNQPPFDVFVNNAGLSESIDETDLREWERILRVNSVVPAVLMAHADKLVADGGVIINISSVYGNERFGDTGLTAYDASKAALNSLTRTFAKKLAPRVRVNAIAPGYVDSRWNADYSEQRRQELAGEQLLQKFVDPEDVANLAHHIAANKSLDGEIIYLDCGITLKAI